jgi:hypothetical protein
MPPSAAALPPEWIVMVIFMDNHLHVLLRLDPDVAQAWSDDEIQQRLEESQTPTDRGRKTIVI